MKPNHILLIVISLVLLSGCTGYDKLVKGRDYQAQYNEALRYYALKKDSKAITLFDNIETIFSGTDKIDTIKFYRAKAAYRQGSYVDAAPLLDDFRKTYSRSPFAEEAEFLYAMSYYEMAPNPELDQTNTVFAINAFEEYMERYENSAKMESCRDLVQELQERLHDKAFMVGKTYYNVGYYNSAIHSFKNMLKEYPDLPQREQVMYLLVKGNYQYAKASVEKKQRERFYNTIDAYYKFTAEYPESQYTDEVERMFRNAQRLSKGQEAIEMVSKEFNLSERTTSRKEKKLMRISDRVDAGTMTETTLNKKVDKGIKKVERLRLKKGDLVADSIHTELQAYQKEKAERLKREMEEAQTKKQVATEAREAKLKEEIAEKEAKAAAEAELRRSTAEELKKRQQAKEEERTLKEQQKASKESKEQ